ncbi:MAG TPA: esterase [Cyanobacteria bacterium UBA11149]|nr:esterase [Cyanobacteria bacterium UBA11367]HBE60814.1 esterase [Cyanobacteria bacterium UBA11366]HBK63437.1 esterase [Cyanobacteria bacterium UBA11166]HBR74402.1 esterase [Cyanobacteria bacterium UBA11159]HBS68670.1 esterase [Cyanobacteria bacterium UBA11153]HBW89814.1 esterase [Cyanobacteria bacterium UBA11149]HCA94612.1 esterase [Cyanobacteria bacterium UBA9226]
MSQYTYNPPWFLRNGLKMTLYIAFKAHRNWEATTPHPEPCYQEKIFIGADGVPIFGIVAMPENPKGTIIGTYGITGDLHNQWFLRILGRKAFAGGYAVVLFDWRAHGKTAELSPTLTSDGLYEGEDFVRIAAQAKAMGCPAPFWFTGFSLGGQLTLWAIKAGQTVSMWGKDLDLDESEIAGGAVICPSLDSKRSLYYLENHPFGRHIEAAIARQLKKLAWHIHSYHLEAIDPEAIKRANTIWNFDKELVIKKLGFSSVEEYYDASNALALLPHLKKPTLILYPADDPMFDPAIIPDMEAACATNPEIDLILTQHGGHVGYISSKSCQRQYGDCDRWWAWNRVLDWCSRTVDS